MTIAFDTETWLIQPGLLAPPLVSVSSFDGTKSQLLLASDGTSLFEQALDSGEIIVGHNLAYDLGVFAAYRPELIPKIFRHFEAKLFRDTKVRQELLDIAVGRRDFEVFRNGVWKKPDYSLAGLGLMYLNKDRSAQKKGDDIWRMRYHELDGAPVDQWPQEARQYALEDAEDTYRVFMKQGPETLVNEPEQVYAAWSLHLMSLHGIRTEKTRVEKLQSELVRKQEKIRRRLIQTGFLEVERATIKKPKKDQVDANGLATFKQPETKIDYWAPNKKGLLTPYRFKKNQELIRNYLERVYTRKGIPAKYTDSGKLSIDRDSLELSGSRLLGLLSDGGGIEKLLTTYVPVLKQGTEVPINARFKVLVNSGRTSCSDPNLQNLPSGKVVGGTRECFIPSPGYRFVSVDYETLELRALAQVCLWLFGKSKMAEALQAGRDDLHAAMAAQIIGVSYEDIMRNKGTPGAPAKKARDAAKVANFGLPGGLGAQSLVDYARKGYGISLTVDQAVRLKKEWLQSWPEMDLYFKYVSKLVGMDFADITQFVSKRVRGGVGYCDGCNTFFQGLAADGAKNALTKVAYECYVDEDSWLFGSRPIAFIHDEILMEVPVECDSEASNRLAEVMCSAMSEYIPDIPIKAEPALMDRWYKDAKKVEVEGRLVPWSPR